MNERICRVCGDRAVGYNFSALTCDSCRSFFRRIAPRAQEFNCYSNNTCDITATTRKLCKKCRIDKCFSVGMKKESTLGSDDYINYLNNKDSIVTSTTDLNVKQYEQSSGDQLVAIPSVIRGVIFSFDELEIKRYKELFASTTVLRDPTLPIVTNTTDLAQAFKLLHLRCDVKCRRIVQMSTQLTPFTQLTEEDKIALLKTSCPQIICLISVLNFNYDGEYWTVCLDDKRATTLRLDVFRFVTENIYEAHRKFMYDIKHQYNSDINIIDLLTAILLFNPNQPNLIHKEVVKLQQQTYIYLLQRYLEVKHNSKSESELRLCGLMNCLQELYPLNRLHVQKIAQTQPQEAGPLVQEIYDIRQQNTLSTMVS